MSVDVTFITSNLAKAEQTSYHLSFPLKHKALEVPEIQSLDLVEVASFKAKRAFELIRTPVLVEDTGLIFNCLNSLPGPFIKWFLKELTNEGLTTLVNHYDDKSAVAQVVFAYYDGTQLKTFTGEMKGSIASAPKGKEGFGWDPIFIPEGASKTWGEMSIEEQKSTSMRKVALEKVAQFLKAL